MSKSPKPKTNPNSLYGTELHWWKGRAWGAAHVYALCPRAFMENPVGFGGLLGIARPERMRTSSAKNALRTRRKPLCSTCAKRFMSDRNNEIADDI